MYQKDPRWTVDPKEPDRIGQLGEISCHEHGGEHDQLKMFNKNMVKRSLKFKDDLKDPKRNKISYQS